MPSICQLQYFLKLAETPHFVRVARLEGITQAALSRTIAKLEEELGILLFDRSDRHSVKLTEAGICYAARVKTSLRNLAEGEREARLTAHGKAGKLKLVLLRETLHCPEIGDKLVKFHRARPSVDLQLAEVLTAGELFRAVEEFRADAGLLLESASGTLPDTLFSRTAAEFRERVGLLHPEADSGDLESCRNSHFILPDPGADGLVSRTFISAFKTMFNRLPVIAATADGTEMVRHLVRARLGIGVIPTGGAIREKDGCFHALPMELNRKIQLVGRRIHPSPAAEAFFLLNSTG